MTQGITSDNENYEFKAFIPFLLSLPSQTTLYTHLCEVLLHFRPEQLFSFDQPSSPDEVHHAIVTQAAVIL